MTRHRLLPLRQLRASATGEPVGYRRATASTARNGRAAPSRPRPAGPRNRSRSRARRRPSERRGQRQPHHLSISARNAGRRALQIDGKFDGLVAIPLGAFDDPYFLQPRFSVWEKRKHDWVDIVGDEVEHSALTRSAAPRLAVDAEEIGAEQFLQPRLAPAALRQLPGEAAVAVDAVVVGDDREDVRPPRRETRCPP